MACRHLLPETSVALSLSSEPVQRRIRRQPVSERMNTTRDSRPERSSSHEASSHDVSSHEEPRSSSDAIQDVRVRIENLDGRSQILEAAELELPGSERESDDRGVAEALDCVARRAPDIESRRPNSAINSTSKSNASGSVRSARMKRAMWASSVPCGPR